jgi:hypothetical protein
MRDFGNGLLGIRRTFTLYKPNEPNAAFLELRDRGRPE